MDRGALLRGHENSQWFITNVPHPAIRKLDINTPNICWRSIGRRTLRIHQRSAYPQRWSECHFYHSSCLIVVFWPTAFCFLKYLQVFSLHAGLHIPLLTADRNTFLDDSCRREWWVAEYEDSDPPRFAEPDKLIPRYSTLNGNFRRLDPSDNIYLSQMMLSFQRFWVFQA